MNLRTLLEYPSLYFMNPLPHDFKNEKYIYLSRIISKSNKCPKVKVSDH